MRNKINDSPLVIHSEAIKISKDGYSFDCKSNKWKLSKDVTISFQQEILRIDKKVLEGFRHTLARYAEELSADHTKNMYLRMQRLIRDTECKNLSVDVLLNWRAKLSNEHEWYLGSLRGFLISWYDFGYYGVTADMVELLESLTLKGNVKGLAVANRCPYSGAFTENEVLAICGELNRLWQSEKISFPCYAGIYLLQATARRSKQLIQLKVCDLINEQKQFFLKIPRAKQRGLSFRQVFKKLSITEDLYLILLNLGKFQIQQFESASGVSLNVAQQQQVPLFLDLNAENSNYELGIDLKAIDFRSEAFHMSSACFRKSYVRNFTKLQKAISERTGDIIHISARRFRHTRGTNLGRKGIGARIIAEALDHSDSQNVKVYTENTADTVQYIDKAVGKQLAPFAKAFLGRIIEDLSDGERGDDPTAKIPNSNNEAIGACGTNDFCVNGFASCYVCQKFRPLVDAPHEDVLESLYEEKEKRLKTTGSVQFASSRDRLILAVEEVVSKCNEIKSARGEERNG